MATNLELLNTEKTRIITALSTFDLNPNASGSGHLIDRVGGRESLLRQLKDINALIELENVVEGGPWEVEA